MIIKNKKTLFPNDRDPRGILIDSPLTQTREKFLTTNRLPSNMIRNNETILRNPKKKKKKKRKKFVDSFISSQHKFHCSIPPEVYEGKKRKMKLVPNSIIAARNTVETRRSAERGLC